VARATRASRQTASPERGLSPSARSRPPGVLGGQRGSLVALPPVSRRQQVADQIREAIVVGVLPPGEQLKQDQLCEELGVSPAPVREAMRQLESEGLVVHYPNRGVFVTDASADELLGLLMPIRLVLERYALTQSGSALTDDVLAELERLVEVMEQGARHGDLRAINEADLRFHELTVAASGSVHAVQLWHSVFPRIRMQIYRAAPRHRALDEIPAEHRELLDALRTRDSDQITAALEEHIVGSCRALLHRPEDPGSPPSAGGPGDGGEPWWIDSAERGSAPGG
jgi:DNA-binding GntR family transcriptional regulator